MNTEALFLFLILLLGLVLCSFLGGNCNGEGFTGNFTGTFQTNDINSSSGSSSSGSSSSGSSSSGSSSSGSSSSGSSSSGSSSSGSSSGTGTSGYDNYNHYSGSSTQLANGSTYYGPNGGSVVVNSNSNGSQSLQVTLANGQSPMTFTTQPPTDASSNSTDPSSNVIESYTTYSGSNGTATKFYGPNGDTATVVNSTNGQPVIQIQTPAATYTYSPPGSYPSQTPESSSTQYYGSTGSPIQSSSYNTTTYQGQNGGSAGAITNPYGNTAYYAQGPNGNAVAGTTNTQYYSSLPPGIPANQIPPGNEDLYILKSQIVPPVCPVCPVASSYHRQKPCPACPACARCPEPSMTCKAVPNYSAMDSQYLPAPVLNDFSTFGM